LYLTHYHTADSRTALCNYQKLYILFVHVISVCTHSEQYLCPGVHLSSFTPAIWCGHKKHTKFQNRDEAVCMHSSTHVLPFQRAL